MSRSNAARAQHGAQELIEEAERVLQKAIAEHGSRAPFSFPNTAYYLPIILGKSAKPVERVGDLQASLQQARDLLTAGTTGPEKATALGLAALFAAEIIEALGAFERPLRLPANTPPTSVAFNSPISDLQVRTLGIQIMDGRMPGVAVLVGCAKNNSVAAALVQELRRHNILCLLSGSIIDQLKQESIELESDTSILPLGSGPISAVHAAGFAARCAMKLGGNKPGMWTQILKYSKRRIPGFVLALGELEDPHYAVALAARDFGFSVIMDTAGSEGKQLVSAPFDSVAGGNDDEKATQLVEKCVAVRGLKLKSYSVDVPLAYGPAFEDQDIAVDDLNIQFGGGGSTACELLQTVAIDEATDGKVEIIGPNIRELNAKTPLGVGIFVRVAGKKLKRDYEPLLEHQIHSFLNYASGVQHIGREDAIAIRVSNMAAAHGLTLESIGRILHARFHQEFTAVEKVEVAVITEPRRLAELRATARDVHERRHEQLASLTDSQVDEFYVCTNCRAFAPNNVSIISPQRVSPCGQCNWLDAKAGYEMKSSGVRRPIKPGKAVDIKKGIWEGLNEYARTASHGRIKEVALYSVTQSPMCACADFECIVMAIPEANGVMVLSHDDPAPTPAGVNVEIFASIAAGEQIPGVAGIGKSHLLSPKFIAAEGGFRRIVWMSSVLKETMAEELKAVCMREGDPHFLDKVADEHQATSVKELVRWLKQHRHPALEMERMF